VAGKFSAGVRLKAGREVRARVDSAWLQILRKVYMSENQHTPVLHGGARPLAMCWHNVGDRPPHTIFRYEVAPGDICNKHVHTGKTETWVIITGFGEVAIGDRRIVVGPGDAIVTPPGTAHALYNTGSDPLQFLNLVTITESAPVTTRELAE